MSTRLPDERLFDSAEDDALDAAQAKLNRSTRVDQRIRVVVWAMVATFALATAAFAGWVLRGLQ